MIRLYRVFAAFLVCVTVAGVGFAQDKKTEAAAKALQKKAMGDDYLATDFAKAREKLEKAMGQCGTDKCSANLRALLRRDLGTVLIGGGVDKKKGTEALAEAYKLDNSIQLDPDYKTKDIESAWEQAKKGGKAAAPAGDTQKGGGGGDQPEGDFNHTPVAEQAVRTGVPIFVDYAGTEVVKIVARYKAFGMKEWKPIELKKTGDSGWGAVTTCLDSQIGKFLYFIQGFSADNEPIAAAGDRKDPFIVQIKNTIDGEAPHLPNQKAPEQCADTGDCPPDFPGCKSAPKMNSGEDLLKDENVDCDTDTECKSKVCKAGKCTAPELQSKDKWPRMWVGASVSLDILFIPSGQNPCSLQPRTLSDGSPNPNVAKPVNDGNYYCTVDGQDFPARTVEGEAVNKDLGGHTVSGAPAMGNLRLLASFDYALTKNFMLGARAGVAILNSYPGSAAKADGNRFGASPLHLEARGTLVFGKDALAKAGIAPYTYLATGISTFEGRFDGKVKVAGVERSYDGWIIGGPVFLSLGGGARYAFTPKAAVMGGLRANLAFGYNVLPSIAPDVAVQFGF